MDRNPVSSPTKKGRKDGGRFIDLKKHKGRSGEGHRGRAGFPVAAAMKKKRISAGQGQVGPSSKARSCMASLPRRIDGEPPSKELKKAVQPVDRAP